MITKIANSSDLLLPAIIFDERDIRDSIRKLDKWHLNVKLLFPIKSFSASTLLGLIASYIDGFAVSSVNEVRLAEEILQGRGSIHVTCPGLRPDEAEELSERCKYISFNSLTQLNRYLAIFSRKSSCGLRINPQLSFVRDSRYNPCRKYSKLGVPLNTLSKITNNGASTLKDIKGLHFHTNCESHDYSQLLKTVKHIDHQIPGLLEQVEWVNLGGGYMIEGARNIDKLSEAISFLKSKYDVEVFIEPGKGIIGKAGYIVSSVVDIFESDGKKIAVLDTTVNHMPEVFEYQFKPDIMEESETGKYSYILAGASCLAGDLFGEYKFDEPLEVGSRIVFENMGAYTLVKANMFNGINLPSIYVLRTDGTLELIKEFTYEDYLSRCGRDKNVTA